MIDLCLILKFDEFLFDILQFDLYEIESGSSLRMCIYFTEIFELLIEVLLQL